MHFVKKVPRTEEEEARNAKEKAKKLRTYCQLRDKINTKQRSDELDDELLELTGEILTKVPDLYSVWNLRRSVLEKLAEKKDNESEEEHLKRKDRLFSGELILTQSCLMTNCKSYCAWFHRGWAFSRIKSRDINHELKMCEKALQMDGRNFHCWDYRRLIAKIANLHPDEELKFSDKMIGANFSNYSAWHYRSSLLPVLFPDPERRIAISEERACLELKNMPNAFFTDPEDQSAWIYSEWLVSMCSRSFQVEAQPKLLSIIMNDEKTQIYATFNVAVCHTELSNNVNVEMEGDFDVHWMPIMRFPRTKFSRLWMATLKGAFRSLEVSNSSSEKYVKLASGGIVNVKELYRIYNVEQRDRNTELEKSVRNLTEQCRILIEELSGDQSPAALKWPVFTYTRCLIELDPAGNEETIIKNLRKLAYEYDPKRREMYREAEAKYLIDKTLRSTNNNGMRIIDELIKNGSLSLKDLDLSSVDHLVYLSSLITSLDLSGNALVQTKFLPMFPRLKQLHLDSNPLPSITDLKCPDLELLSIAGCFVSEVHDVDCILECDSLSRFIFCETALSEDNAKSESLRKIINENGRNIRLIRHWL